MSGPIHTKTRWKETTLEWPFYVAYFDDMPWNLCDIKLLGIDMRQILIALVLLAPCLLAAGCRDKGGAGTAQATAEGQSTPAVPGGEVAAKQPGSDSAAPEVPATGRPLPAGALTPAEIANAPVPAGTPVTPIVISPTNNLKASLGQMTQAARKFSFDLRRQPKNFSEVVQAGYVVGVPTPPAGKKFELDSKTHQVVLVNQ